MSAAPDASGRRIQLSRAKPVLASALVIVATLIVYRRSFAVYFLNEDFIWLRVCRFLPGRGLWTLLTHDVMVGRYSWRPLVQVSFAFNYWLGGLHPFVYRLEVLIWHIAGALLVYVIVDRLTDATRALIAALVFAVHPLQVESLAWTCARGGPISTAFILAAVLGYLHWRRGGSALWVGLPFALAVASQENAVVLFGLLMTADILLGDGTAAGYRRWGLYAVLALVAVAFFAVHVWMSPSQLGFTMAGLDSTRPFSFGALSGILAKLQIAAAMMLMMDPAHIRIAAWALVVAGVVAVVRWRQGAPLASWGLMWIVVSLAPYTLLLFGPFPRYMHLPLVGFAMLVGDLAVYGGSLLRHLSAWLKPVFLATIAALWFGAAIVAVGEQFDGFEQRSRLTRSLLEDLQRELPQPRSATTVAFYRVGELRVNDGIFIFGLEDAVRLIYGDDSLRVLFPALGDGVPADYHLIYLNGRLRRFDSPT